MSSSCAITPTRGCARLSMKYARLFIGPPHFRTLLQHRNWSTAACDDLRRCASPAMLPFGLLLIFAGGAPFVSYCCARLAMLIGSLGISKMLSVQQTAPAHRVALPFVSGHCEWQPACFLQYSDTKPLVDEGARYERGRIWAGIASTSSRNAAACAVRGLQTGGNAGR